MYEWNSACKKAGLEQDAIYLLRPDTYVALALRRTTPEVLSQYFQSRGYKTKEVVAGS